ncbi:hypothetical protein IC800_15610 [Acinetobacter seifertii]|uniref:hypothetical protein n=1 Tax=Acinetobacter seifertii TaxID=1530123 RepID=UPI00168D32D9|nr:hypothetical protein [Acinetobacter seifertii]QNW94347.1 hypothetical protein IC800_15610 [Acinetobacter seifertii]
MKAVAVICSPECIVDGDLIFIDVKKFRSSTAVLIESPNSMVCTKRGLQIHAKFNHKEMNIKVMLLWFWHMVILRKSHVYLTKALK